MKLFKFLNPTIFFLFLIFPIFVDARIGVGVGNGRIQIEEDLKAGGFYQLPSLPILNTGDEASDYEVTIEYQEDVSELLPNREWFSFSPQKFSLDPGNMQNVGITLSLSPDAQPGKYFAYLEGHPIKKDTDGLSNVGIAAATKLYFTVVSANNFESIYYGAIRMFNYLMPWPIIILIIIILIILIFILGKKFSFTIEAKKK